MTYVPFPNDPNPYPVQILDGAGSTALYLQASGLERALADTESERLLQVHAELVRAQWDPYAISFNNLPYLAYAMGVNLWEDDYWSEGTKRDWVSRQWQFKAIRGTPAAIRMALGASAYDLVQMVRPPQGFYASPDLTPEQWNKWIHMMPELRIKFIEGIGSAPNTYPATEYEWICNDGYAIEASAARDDGPALYGRRAVLRRNGVDTPIQVSSFTEVDAFKTAQEWEQYFLPGRSTQGYVADEDFEGEDKFVCFEETHPDIVSVELDTGFVMVNQALHLTAVWPSLTPLTANYERNSDIGNAGDEFMVNDFADERFANNKFDAFDMLADRIFLLDPTIQGILTEGLSFAGVSRVGLPTYYAELQVDVHTKDNSPGWFAEFAYPGETYAMPEDLTDMDRALRAVAAAVSLRDTVPVSFETVLPIAFGDDVAESNSFGDEIPTPL